MSKGRRRTRWNRGRD